MLAVDVPAAVHAAPTCAGVPGIASVVASKARIIIFGEVHGTADLPAFFFQAVCAASQIGPVTVALEHPPSEQGLLDCFLVSQGAPGDRRKLIESPSWTMNLTMGGDGRTSVAMLDLIDNLRQLKQSGRDIRVVYAQGGSPLGQAYGESITAGYWSQAASERPKAKLFVLVGSAHARKVSSNALTPAASHLPPQDVLVLKPQMTGGEAWFCKVTCGVALVAAAPGAERGISLFGEVRDGFDGTFSTGAPWTASPPAKL